MKRKGKLWLGLMLVLTVAFTSYGYAALNTELSLSGEAYLRVDGEVRITDIKATSIKNGASETFNSKYSKNSITMGVNLKNNTSEITYEYTVKNETNEDYLIANVNVLSNLNSSISYSNSGSVNTVIPANSVKKFQVTFRTTGSSQNTSLALEFEFNPDRVTPPILAGGSTSWSPSNLTISINTPGTATSGVKNYEYYISNSKNDPGNNVTGTTSGNVTVTNAGERYVFYRTVSNTGKKSLWSAYQTTKIDSATPPTLTGGNTSWTSGNRIISIKSAGTALSGVKNYEYYVSSSIKDPGDNVTGTIEGTLIYSKEGTNYIYYRTVSNAGKKSAWSSYQTTKIDKTTPAITMKAAGTYYLSNTNSIATATYGPSGGKITCSNTTMNINSISKFSQLGAIGKITVKCTATGNTGKSASSTVTYTLNETYNGANMPCTSNTTTASCAISGTSKTVPPQNILYGPYRKASKGCYKVTYDGTGFNNNLGIDVYQNSPSVGYTPLSKSITGTRITYYVNVPSDASGSGLEFVLRNNGSSTVTVKTIKVEVASSCPAS